MKLSPELIDRVLRQVRIAMEHGHVDAAVSAIKSVSLTDHNSAPMEETSLADLLPLKIANMLEAAGYQTVGDLDGVSPELLQIRIRHFGPSMARQVSEAMAKVKRKDKS